MTERPRLGRLLLCAALAWSAGCHRRGEAKLPGSPAVPTWSHDIAPLLARRCGTCHGNGQSAAVAPPALGGYREARQAAAQSLRAIRRRMMPPFGADDTGLCGTWSDAAWLTDEEIAAFGAWVEHDMPHGLGPPSRPPAEPAPIAAPLTTLDPGPAFTPGLGERACRCFLVAAPADGTLLTGVTVRSEPRAAVRQANLYALADFPTVARARAMDSADPEPGWPCPGTPGATEADLVGSWSRDTPRQRAPDGTGIPLSAPAYVAQVRYDLIASGPGIPVQARFLLTTASPAPGRAARLLPLRPTSFTLAPNQAQSRITATWIVDHVTTFRGLVPRMNALGRTLDLQVTHEADHHCLAHFGHWDPYDQQLFHTTAAVPLARGDTVTLSCTFNTTSRTAGTKMGEAPDEEQCLAHLYLVD